MLDKKIRKMQKFLDAKKKDLPELQKESEISPEEKAIEDLSQKVEEATKVMEFEEKRVQIELHKQVAEISNLEHEVEITALKLREKEQECRLCELKIKELKRQTRHNALKPLELSTPANPRESQSYREFSYPSGVGKSENDNIMRNLSPYKPLELTEENMKLYDENLKSLEKDEDYEFYSN